MRWPQKKKPAAKAKTKMTKTSTRSDHPLSPELADVLGIKEVPHAEATRKPWEYTKAPMAKRICHFEKNQVNFIKSNEFSAIQFKIPD